MDKSNYREQIKNICEQIKENSNDSHITEQLLLELLSAQKQLDHEPLPIGDLGAELGRYKGATFYVAKHEKGALYHIYNSIYITVPMSQTALYQTLASIVDNQEENAKLEGDEKQFHESYMSAVGLVLAAPTYVFTDVAVCFDVATRLVTFLRESYEKALSQPLQEETIEVDEAFREAHLATEELKGALKDER